MKKSKQNTTVIMTGPAASVKGGMRTVVNQYLSWEDWGNIDLLYIPTHLEDTAIKKAGFFFAQFLKILTVCIAKKADILHLHVSERGSFWRKAIILRVCRLFRIKTILHHHGAEFFPFFENASAPAKKQITKTIELADVNLVLSNYHRQIMLDRFPRGHFEVLYNAISPSDSYGYDPDAAGILFVGRLGERKGIYDLIDALEMLDADLPADVRFFFCGDGEVEKVAAILREKSLEHRLAHIGWCSREQLSQIYRQTMLFILPSYHEGLPMALLEAMYAGIPCISTNVDGIPETVKSGCNGILIEPGNLEQMKDSLLQLVRDRQKRVELGRNGHVTVCEQFLLQSHIEKLKKLYSKNRG